MKILFVKFGKFSHTNEKIYHILKIGYPDYEIKVVDALKILKSNFFFIITYPTFIILFMNMVWRCFLDERNVVIGVAGF